MFYIGQYTDYESFDVFRARPTVLPRVSAPLKTNGAFFSTPLKTSGAFLSLSLMYPVLDCTA
jgi:hypothetical protein